MPSNLNRVLLHGRVISPPEISVGPEQKSRARFTLETRDTWRDRATGVRRSKAERHEIVVTNHVLANIVAEHVRVGTRLFVEGSLRTRAPDGHRLTEVLLGPFKSTLELLDDKDDQPGDPEPVADTVDG